MNSNVGTKTLKLEDRNYSNFIITYPTIIMIIWRCAVDFQGFTEILNGRHGSTSIFWWALKLKNDFGHFFLILTSHSQHVQVIF